MMDLLSILTERRILEAIARGDLETSLAQENL